MESIERLKMVISNNQGWYYKGIRERNRFVAERALRKMDAAAKKIADLTHFHIDCKN